MVDEPKIGFISLLLAKIVCCCGLLLVATGGFGGIGVWLSDGGGIWIVGAGLLLAAIAVIWRRRNIQASKCWRGGDMGAGARRGQSYGVATMVLNLMTIGQLFWKTDVTARAIRHYERLNLIRAPLRTETNYRLFDSETEARAQFSSKCRALGFSIPEIANLLQVTDDPDHTCAQVADLTRQHLELIDRKLQILAEMRGTLETNLSRCTGKDIQECPVLDFLQNAD